MLLWIELSKIRSAMMFTKYRIFGISFFLYELRFPFIFILKMLFQRKRIICSQFAVRTQANRSIFAKQYVRVFFYSQKKRRNCILFIANISPQWDNSFKRFITFDMKQRTKNTDPSIKFQLLISLYALRYISRWTHFFTLWQIQSIRRCDGQAGRKRRTEKP